MLFTLLSFVLLVMWCFVFGFRVKRQEELVARWRYWKPDSGAVSRDEC